MGNNINYDIWNTFKPTTYTVRSIHYFAKQDDIQRYHTLMRIHNTQADETILAETINIERRYLFDKDKLLDDPQNHIVCGSVENRFQEHTRTCNKCILSKSRQKLKD